MIAPAGLSLPSRAYLPGQGSEPERGLLERAKALVPKKFEGGVPVDHPAVCYGIALFYAGFFWEAHEVLEAVWKAAPKNGRDRIALRALIQLANAGFKGSLGQAAAQARLLGEVRAELFELSVRRPGPQRGNFADSPDIAALISLLRAVEEGTDLLRGLMTYGLQKNAKYCQNR